MSAPTRATVVVLAGGGTGGHIFPNVAIAEALRSRREHADVHYIVSNRPGDASTMQRIGDPWTASPARPLPSLSAPATIPAFGVAWTRATAQAAALLRRTGAHAIVATGGFVSGPALLAARAVGIPSVMVNLDAVPGAANRSMRRLCTKVFSAYESVRLPDAEIVGLPLRRASVANHAPADARRSLQLDPERPTLLITGATHGAESIAHACVAMLRRDAALVAALSSWQVLHQCGTLDPEPLRAAYRDAGVPARVVDYLDAMGPAYAAADLVLGRAGAGSVAEAWANAVPTVFMPNPYHADQHQRFNAEPMERAGAAAIVADAIDPADNAARLGPLVRALIVDDSRRADMRRAALRSRPPDGADAIAAWLCGRLE